MEPRCCASGNGTTLVVISRITEAEAQAAALLADGLSPNEIAGAKAVKVSTVRTLLERGQTKAGARNLRDLVRIMAVLR